MKIICYILCFVIFSMLPACGPTIIGSQALSSMNRDQIKTKFIGRGTKKEEIIAYFGKPNSVSLDSNGSSVTYSSQYQDMKDKGHIGSHTIYMKEVRNKSATFYFDKNDILTKFTYFELKI